MGKVAVSMIVVHQGQPQQELGWLLLHSVVVAGNHELLGGARLHRTNSMLCSTDSGIAAGNMQHGMELAQCSWAPPSSVQFSVAMPGLQNVVGVLVLQQGTMLGTSQHHAVPSSMALSRPSQAHPFQAPHGSWLQHQDLCSIGWKRLDPPCNTWFSAVMPGSAQSQPGPMMH